MLTGGEPLLLPGLAERLSTLARRAGSRTALLSGMFFARGGGLRGGRNGKPLPPAILRAIRSVDHFSASLDVHHEREVSRADVFRALRRVREEGVAVSLHLTGTGAADPYLADLTRAVREEFGGAVPCLVNEVRPFGRAASWARAARTGPDPAEASPCSMAAWPVVGFDGRVLACCNQDTVDRLARTGAPGPRPHRGGRLGDGTPTGPGITGVAHAPHGRARASRRPLRVGPPARLLLRELPGARRRRGGGGRGPRGGERAGALLDLTAAMRGAREGAQGVVRRHGCAAYAPLVVTGGPGLPESGAEREDVR